MGCTLRAYPCSRKSKMAGKGEEEVGTQEINKENDSQEQTESEKIERVNKLPLTRIKHIIKMDPDVTLASQDAVILIAKAAVCTLVTFLQNFISECEFAVILF